MVFANNHSRQMDHKLHYQWGRVSVTRTTGPINTSYKCKEVSHNRNGQFTMTNIRVEEGILQEEHSLLTSP